MASCCGWLWVAQVYTIINCLRHSRFACGRPLISLIFPVASYAGISAWAASCVGPGLSTRNVEPRSTFGSTMPILRSAHIMFRESACPTFSTLPLGLVFCPWGHFDLGWPSGTRPPLKRASESEFDSCDASRSKAARRRLSGCRDPRQSVRRADEPSSGSWRLRIGAE
jgi:hypothetical protein